MKPLEIEISLTRVSQGSHWHEQGDSISCTAVGTKMACHRYAESPLFRTSQGIALPASNTRQEYPTLLPS